MSLVWFRLKKCGLVRILVIYYSAAHRDFLIIAPYKYSYLLTYTVFTHFYCCYKSIFKKNTNYFMLLESAFH